MAESSFGEGQPDCSSSFQEDLSCPLASNPEIEEPDGDPALTKSCADPGAVAAELVAAVAVPFSEGMAGPEDGAGPDGDPVLTKSCADPGAVAAEFMAAVAEGDEPSTHSPLSCEPEPDSPAATEFSASRHIWTTDREIVPGSAVLGTQYTIDPPRKYEMPSPQTSNLSAKCILNPGISKRIPTFQPRG